MLYIIHYISKANSPLHNRQLLLYNAAYCISYFVHQLPYYIPI